MEEFRAEESAITILFSPSKVQKGIELKECREQAVLGEDHENQLRFHTKSKSDRVGGKRQSDSFLMCFTSMSFFWLLQIHFWM
jgi:hypothetical protein